MQPNVDLIVGNMLEWVKMARQMPKSFDGHGIAYDVGSDDSVFGKILPGRGFMSKVDLRSLGITKQPPGVYDPSRYRRIEDEVRRRMARAGTYAIQGAAISTYDQIITQRAGGFANDIAFVKTTFTTTANVWYSLFTAGGQPGAGTPLATTAPTDRVADRSTAGSISLYLANPAGTARKYILTFGFTAASQINMAVLVDVVNDGGIYRMAVNTAETVVTPTNATRQYGSGTGIGNLLTFIVQAAGTPGAGTMTAQYIDQAGSATNAPALTSAAAAVIVGAIFPSSVGITAGAGSFFVPLAAASTGVQAVKQNTMSVTGTGSLAHNVFFPLLFVPGLAANAYIERDSTTQIDGLTEMVNASQVIGSLQMYVLPNTTSTGALTGYLKTVSG